MRPDRGIFRLMMSIGLAIASTASGQVLGDPLPVERGTLHAGVMQRNIRSRHLDLVVDAEGAAYVATFHRPTPQSVAHILIEKRARDGEVAWQRGVESPGRAMSLAIMPDEGIVVTGFVHGQLAWDQDPSSTVIPADEARPFFVRFDASGEPRVTRYGPAGVAPTLVRAGPDGAILIVGHTDADLTWDDQTVTCDGETPLTFVGVFDTNGVCQLLRPVRGRVFVAQAASMPGGEFVIGGGYLERLEYDGETAHTEGNLDRNAFLLRLDRDANLVSLSVRGAAGNERPGYRSREGVQDLAVKPSGELVAASLLDWPGHGRDRLIIDRYQPDGTQIGSHIIHGEIASPGSVSVAVDEQGVILVTSCMKGTDAGEAVLSVFRISTTGDIASAHEQGVSVNTMARSIAARDGVLWLAGHFTDSVGWGERTIRSDSGHQMFVVVQPLK